MARKRQGYDVMGDGVTGRPAVIYCRVSDVKQVSEGDGLNSQETGCREYASRRGYTVVEVYKEHITGGTANRPAMAEMLAYLGRRRSLGVVVIIDDISRLARGLAAHLEIRTAIASAGGVLESPSIEFGEDADSLLVENLLASVSLHHRQKNREQTKNRMRGRLLNGYWVYQAPAGYAYPAHHGARLRDGARRAPRLGRARGTRRLCLGPPRTQADVQRFLAANPLFPKDGPGHVRHDRVQHMLTQWIYAGYIERPNWDVSRRLGMHEPLISLETFQRIQDRLNGIGRAAYRKNLNADFALRGFVECVHCGTPLTACWSKGSNADYPHYL